MSGTNAKRQQLKQVYSTPTWARKVDRMSDGQVIAIFMRLRREGKL